MTDPTHIGRIIREARLEHGMSLGQLASAVGRSSSSVRRWERGEVVPATTVAPKLAAILEIDPDIFASRKDASSDGNDLDATSADRDVTPGSSTFEQPVSVPPVTADVVQERTATAGASGSDRGLTGGIVADIVAALNLTHSNWSGWLRAGLTTVALVVMMVVLVWAAGELLDAVGAIWESFDVGTTPRQEA